MEHPSTRPTTFRIAVLAVVLALSPTSEANGDPLDLPQEEVLARFDAATDATRLVDAKLGRDGAVWWLTRDWRLHVWRAGDRTVYEVPDPPESEAPSEFAVAPDGSVHLLGDGEAGLLVFDPGEGRIRQRLGGPAGISPATDIVASEDAVYVAGFSERGEAQVHRFGLGGAGTVASLGDFRVTEQEFTAPYLQGGSLVLHEGSLLHAWINPLRVDRIELSTGTVRTVVEGDLLPDGEEAVFTRNRSGQWIRTNAHARATGLVAGPDGSVYVSVFFPWESASRILHYSPGGDLLESSDHAQAVSLRGILPDGRLVVIRAMGRQEIVLLDP